MPSFLEKYNLTHQKAEKTDIIFTICLDMLHLMCTGDIPDPDETGVDAIEMDESIALLKLPYGSPIFKHLFEVYQDGELVAKISAHPRKLTRGIKENYFTLRIENHVLYTVAWYGVVTDILTAVKGNIHNVSRIDVAMDGLNHVHSFLNEFVKQTKEGKKCNMKGRARLSAKVLDHDSMTYKAFSVGSGSSDKQVTVYHKSEELNKSHKEYIKEFWKANGIDPDENEVYRVELRLKSKAIQELPDFSLAACTNMVFLFNLFKTCCHNFFDFTKKEGDKTITRQERVKLMPYDWYKTDLLEKRTKPVFDGAYKAKMAIHLTVKNTFKGLLWDNDFDSARQAMLKNIELYHLQDWYLQKLPEWIKLYNKLFPGGRNSEKPDMVKLLEIKTIKS